MTTQPTGEGAHLCPTCQTPAPTPTSEQEPLRLCPDCRLPQAKVAGKYLIERELAEGGCGILYLARHTRLQMDPWRVIKFLLPDYFAHPNAAERFEREVEITAALSQRNPHIVRVYDDFGAFPELGRYYVMEYLEGEDLKARIEREPLLPLKTIYHIIRQIVTTLHDAHQQDIIHRDLKPHNIFLVSQMGDDCFVKVIDFGIAKSLSRDHNKGLTQDLVIGTPEYMSPEQCKGLPVDVRTDQYSLATMLYELLVGRTPFLPPNAHGITAMQMAIAHMTERPQPPSELAPERQIPKALDEVLLRALATEPEERFADISSFWEAAEAALEAAPSQVQSPQHAPIYDEFAATILNDEDDLYEVPKGPKREADNSSPNTKGSGGLLFALIGVFGLLALAATGWALGWHKSWGGSPHAPEDTILHTAGVKSKACPARGDGAPWVLLVTHKETQLFHPAYEQRRKGGRICIRRRKGQKMAHLTATRKGHTPCSFALPDATFSWRLVLRPTSTKKKEPSHCLVRR